METNNVVRKTHYIRLEENGDEARSLLNDLSRLHDP
jgi:hypothetical protein